jgi:hypothetical protein
MPLIPIQPAGSLGVIYDQKPHELTPTAWSDARNVRFLDGYAARMSGEESVMPTVATAPIWLLPFFTSTTAWWIYAGTAAVYATDGTNHYSLDGAGAPYAATLDANWTGGMLNSIPILSNPVNGPFYLPGPTPATLNLTVLPNWTYGTVAAMTCRTMRPFRNYLIAYDITKTVGTTPTRYPQLVKWSHAADPGSLPISWDEADTRYDTGEFPLADTDGAVVDALPLRDLNVVYKEDCTYLMQWVGGAFIFRFQKAFSSLGILGPKCMAMVPQGEHVVLAQDDIVLHNGTTAQSLVDRRMRRNLFARLDSTYYGRSFVAQNNAAREIWICIPEVGHTLPNLAFVWNWGSNTWTTRELNFPAFITSAVASLSGAGTWDATSGAWDSREIVWDFRPFNPAVPYFIGAYPNETQLRLHDIGGSFVGTNYDTFLERIGLGVPFDANQPPDTHSVKFVRGVWPRIEGSVGASVTVEVGSQFDLSAPVVWASPRTFVIGSTEKIDVRVSGRLLAFRVSSLSDVVWRLHGFDVDVVRGGGF